jgi:hypothetical protein
VRLWWRKVCNDLYNPHHIEGDPRSDDRNLF